MKKCLFIIMAIFLISGCKAKDDSTNVIKEFINNVNHSKSYKLSGKMELLNDEETFNYTIDVSYLSKDYYKVEMLNTTNEHKQIILKNDDGLYVVTPSLNKSFKFESTWPDNSSQAYILSSLVKDIENDNESSVSKQDDLKVIKSKVNYPNNDDLQYQKIYLDEKYNIKKVEVYGESDLPKIKVVLDDVDLKAGLKSDEFDLKNYVSNTECEEDNCETEETLSKIENAIYPLYMPSNTYLSSSEVVNTEQDSRVILTFSGDKNFVIVEESASASAEHEIIPVYGEPLMLNDTIAALSSNSMYWTSNSIDYYIVSDDLSISEMVFIATSLGNSQATLATK
ncbi:MAG: outer membrane lipoprotein carrier protein LolA [Firmicutes bacterium]|nr:outer membrane lipoprotein carrier protein LolA [Bacillota bacterium]